MPSSSLQNYSFRRPPANRRDSTKSIPGAKDSSKSLNEVAQDVKRKASNARLNGSDKDVTGQIASLKKAHQKELETLRKSHQVEINNVEAIAVR